MELISDKLGIRHKIKQFPYFEKLSYIYFLTNCGEVVYVGQTKNLPNRLKSHQKDREFDDVFYFEVEFGRDILSLESANRDFDSNCTERL